LPSELVELIEVTLEIRASCRSSGVATDVAMVSAFAPGSVAVTRMVGISTCGTPAIGRQRVGNEAQQGDADHQQASSRSA